ncbi:MAG: iron-sulfur cluster assembly protein [Alphaproteobacteria bacterium]|nr:iron-sulfur cluster assembly protein [Alphaproteobacteria bacterium]
MHSDSQTSVDLAAGRDRDHAMQSASPAEPSARTSDDDTTATPDNDEIVAALSSVFDPEIPVDIYSLGLIYAVDIMQHDVHLTMTLTTPNCPVAGSLPQEVADTVVACPGVENVSVTLTFDPPWTIDSMSDDARLVLGY